MSVHQSPSSSEVRSAQTCDIAGVGTTLNYMRPVYRRASYNNHVKVITQQKTIREQEINKLLSQSMTIFRSFQSVEFLKPKGLDSEKGFYRRLRKAWYNNL